MGFLKKFEQKINGTSTSPPDVSKARVNGNARATNGVPGHAHVNSNVPRQQSRLWGLEENRLQSPDLPRTYFEGPASITTVTNQSSSRRQLKAVQNFEAEMHPGLQRMPTSKSVKEIPHGVTMKAVEDTSQIGTGAPGPRLGTETALNPDHVYNELARNLAAMRDRELALASSLKEKEEQTRQRDIQISELLERQKDCIRTTTDLKTQLREEQEKNTKLDQTRKRLVAALAKNRSQEASYKVDDKSLEALYQELIFNVTSWADRYCVLDMNQLPESELKPFLSLTAIPSKYLGHKRTQSLLLKSLVMRILVRVIFTVSDNNESGLWWAGKQAQELRTMYITLMPAEPHAIPALLEKGTLRSSDVKDFSQWKAKSALLLSQHVEPPVMKTNISIILRDLKEELTPFVRRNETNLWSDLGDVVEKAINLDLEMSKSRALFRVHDWSTGDLGKLDRTRLEAAAGFKQAQPGLTVELVIAPSLTKTGSADGDSFGTMLFISNWIVVSTEGRESMKKMHKMGK